MRRVGVLIVLVGLLMFAGCSRSVSLDPNHDTEFAKDTLISALEAWKSGEVETLAKRIPPIRFADDDQIAGAKLTAFELDQNIEIVPFKNVKVDLVLQDHRGQVLRKTVTYQVGLGSDRTVLRSDN